MEHSGKLILVGGPMGSGKGTLMRHALERFPSVSSPKSYTTRARRDYAGESQHYVFISREDFEAKIAANAFLEWAEFSGNYYGTLRAEVEKGLQEGKVMFKEMEVQGMRQVRSVLPKSSLTIVYIDAGPWEELRQRALGRAPMTDEELEKRRLRYEDEVTFMPEADIVVRNYTGKYEAAEAAFESIIEKALDEAAS
jgi:guanylate kinase